MLQFYCSDKGYKRKYCNSATKMKDIRKGAAVLLSDKG